MTSTDVDDRVRAAARAARSARVSSIADRAAWLRAVADGLDDKRDELIDIAHEETHLGEARLRGEVARTTGQLRFFAGVLEEGSVLEVVIDHADPSATPPRPELRRMLQAVGPVAVYAASNFPFAFSVAGGDTASALATGCPVVVKAHPGHPRLSQRTAEIVTEALQRAGAPDGLFGLVDGFEAGRALVEHPEIRAAAFTGSLRGGRALFDLAAARPAPIPFFGELGSINPVVVTPAADAARGLALADGLAQSFQLGAGQFCTKPGVVFVPRGSQLEASIVGHVAPAAPPLLTESITDSFAHGVAALLEAPGAELIAGATPEADGTIRPAVIAVDVVALADHREELLAEVFGPVTLLIRYERLDALPEVLAELEGSLTATLHAEPAEEVGALVSVLEERAGRILFAGWPTGVAVTWGQNHGGPWPSTTSAFTSVGATAIRRFLRPVVYQDATAKHLPPALQDENPWGIPRRVDGVMVG